jgi:hypothetical protein
MDTPIVVLSEKAIAAGLLKGLDKRIGIITGGTSKKAKCFRVLWEETKVPQAIAKSFVTIIGTVHLHTAGPAFCSKK